MADFSLERHFARLAAADFRDETILAKRRQSFCQFPHGSGSESAQEDEHAPGVSPAGVAQRKKINRARAKSRRDFAGVGPSGTTKSWSRPGSTSWAPGCRGAICPGAFGLCGAVYPRGWRRCARGRCARRLAVVPQGAIGKRRPTDGLPIMLHQGGSNPPGRPGTQAIGRTKGRSNRPSDWANAHWPNRTPAARSVRQISVPEPGDMSPGFASAANAALGGISTRKRRKDVAWLRSNPMERAARVCGRSRFARMRTTETGGRVGWRGEGRGFGGCKPPLRPG